MDTVVSRSFNDAFDPMDSRHCVWFKMLADLMAQPGEDMKDHGAKVLRVMTSNPMEVKFDTKNLLDVVFIQFALGLKYSQAVLGGTAWSPPSPKTLQE
jgi:hypothetical protein